MPFAFPRRLARAAVIVALLAPLAAAPSPGAAQDTGLAQASAPLPAPQGRVILSVGGAIGNGNAGGEAVFDLQGLQAFRPIDITTATPWTDGVTTFTGIPFAALMDAVDAQGGRVRITALNDYSAGAEIRMLTEAGAILAYAADGRQLSVREKGPLWVIFPFDSDPDLRTDAYWGVSVWQVARITVE
jgi:hypothetical protein